ncbi:MAG: hypothetical protein IPG99_16535 [Ignavibacteria bacterium]|nr:hypothetical protein [Ignavibacteria bacterium]
MPQLHSWFLDNVEIHFEPTNELIDLITNLGISRGARGLILYAWNSNKDNPSESEYSRGLTESGGTLRQQNVYQQEKTKKQTVIDLVNRVEKWEPYLMSFDNANRKAFTYQNQTEREQMIAGTFIRQLLTYPCISYAPDTIPDLDNIQLDARIRLTLKQHSLPTRLKEEGRSISCLSTEDALGFTTSQAQTALAAAESWQ